MNPEQTVALLGAIATLIGAITALFVQVRVLSRRVDGRLEELLALTRKNATAEGVLEGRVLERGGDQAPTRTS